jgi:hypothetical protein
MLRSMCRMVGALTQRRTAIGNELREIVQIPAGGPGGDGRGQAAVDGLFAFSACAAIAMSGCALMIVFTTPRASSQVG